MNCFSKRRRQSASIMAMSYCVSCMLHLFTVCSSVGALQSLRNCRITKRLRVRSLRALSPTSSAPSTLRPVHLCGPLIVSRSLKLCFTHDACKLASTLPKHMPQRAYVCIQSCLSPDTHESACQRVSAPLPDNAEQFGIGIGCNCNNAFHARLRHVELPRHELVMKARTKSRIKSMVLLVLLTHIHDELRGRLKIKNMVERSFSTHTTHKTHQAHSAGAAVNVICTRISQACITSLACAAHE